MYRDQNGMGGNQLQTLTRTTPQPRLQGHNQNGQLQGAPQGMHPEIHYKHTPIQMPHGFDLKSGQERSEAAHSPRYHMELYNDTGNIDQQIAQIGMNHGSLSEMERQEFEQQQREHRLRLGGGNQMQDVFVPITNKVVQVKAKSESLQMAIDMTQKIKNQTQQLIKERIINVQKQIQEQKAEQKRNNLTNDVVQTVEKQVVYQDAVADKFLSKFNTSKATNSIKKKNKPPLSPTAPGYTPNESFNDRESRSVALDQIQATNSSKGRKNTNAKGQMSGSGKTQLPTPVEEPGNEEEPVNGRGIFQNPVQDEEEPGHVPMADIMKLNKEEMQQQQSGPRPPSKQNYKPPDSNLTQMINGNSNNQQANNQMRGAENYNKAQANQLMNSTMQESQQSGGSSIHNNQVQQNNNFMMTTQGKLKDIEQRNAFQIDMNNSPSPHQETNYSEEKFHKQRVSAFNNQEIMGEPITREPPTPVDRLDYALIMSQEQQEALQGLAHSTLMNTDDDDFMDQQNRHNANRIMNIATTSKNNSVVTSQQQQQPNVPAPAQQRPVQQQQQRGFGNRFDEEQRERRHIREQDKGHQPFNDMDAGRMSDDEPEVARIKNKDKSKQAKQEKKKNNMMMNPAPQPLMQRNFAAMNDSMGFNNDQPKAARNMGFPDMKYLDPDYKGQPIQEKTLYKEYQNIKDNDIKNQREGAGVRRDMANNTFIKLFQASENPDKREELQSVQYAEQILDEDETSANEDTQIIVQRGKISMTNNVKFDLNLDALMSPQGANQQYAQGKAKSKSLGKIGEPVPHDQQNGRGKSLRKDSQISRQKMMLSPDKQQQHQLQSMNPQNFQEQMPRILENNLAPVAEVTTEYKSSQQLPPLQNNKGKGQLRPRFQLDPSTHSEHFTHSASNKLAQQPTVGNILSQHGNGGEPSFQGNMQGAMINSSAHGFQMPQGMTKVPLVFSGSIPSLQYQDSSKGTLALPANQPGQQNISAAQAFLNQQMSRSTAHSKRNGQDGSTHLPPLHNNSNDMRAHFFDGQGDALSKGSSRRFAATGNDETQGSSQFILNVTNRIEDQESAKLMFTVAQSKAKKKKFTSARAVNYLENIMPAPDVINQELMNHFGGRELTEMHEMQQVQRMTTLSSQMVSPGNDKQRGRMQATLENHSCMSVKSPEKLPKFNTNQDKNMATILQKYKEIMNSGQMTAENLQLKKIRYHHPIFRDLSFNAFKMIFDKCEIVQIKKGDKLYKQDAAIGAVYFVMHGRLTLTYVGRHEIVKENGDVAYLGQTLGEEILFYREPLYRETAVCASAKCWALQMNTGDLMELGDESFIHRGLGGEAMKNDVELLFQKLSHIYNRKERWRIMVAACEAEAAKQKDTNYTQFIKSH